MDTTPSSLHVLFFDGQSARGQSAVICVTGSGRGAQVRVYSLHSRALLLRAPVTDVRWPERTQGGSRVAYLPQGTSVQAPEPALWDNWMRACVHPHDGGESWVVRTQQSWRLVAVAMVLLLGTLWGVLQYGMPLAARGIVYILPHSIDAAVGEHTFARLEDIHLEPSQVPQARQQAIIQRFDHIVRLQYAGKPPPYRVLFRKGSGRLKGPNAFALPGGTMVVLDDMVQLARDNDDMLLGVLGHEMGHIAHRDGIRRLVEVSATGVLVSTVFGDYASLLAAAPLLLVHMQYSRDAERAADAHALAFMRAGGISAEVMAQLFERLSAASSSGDKDDTLLGISLRSHPATRERIAYFRNAAQ